MREAKIKDVLSSWNETHRVSGDEIRRASAAYAFSDPELKAEAGITTFREARLFSVWFMEALRDAEGINQNAGDKKVFAGHILYEHSRVQSKAGFAIRSN